MSYLVLARKFRPQTFASIVGQEHITKALANSVLRDRVPHALLLTGPRGVGKTTTARVFAKALNCSGRDLEIDFANFDEEDSRRLIEPCGECTNCIEISRSSSMSVWEIDGASNNSVDNVRELIDSLRTLPPPGSRYKIYIIDEVHMLSVAAFNALLKSLEEPPPNTIFIFATTEPHKIPETVLSRCQRHDFRRISFEVIAEQLEMIAEKEAASVEKDVFSFIARRAQGGLRDAQSMFDRLLAFSNGTISLSDAESIFGVVGRHFFYDLSRSIFEQQPWKSLELLDQLFARSIDVRLFVSDFLSHWRMLLLLSMFRGSAAHTDGKRQQSILELGSLEFEELTTLIEGRETFLIQRLFGIAQEVSESAMQSGFPRYALEAGISRMATLESLRPIADIIEEIKGGVRIEATSSSASQVARKQAPKVVMEPEEIALPSSAFDPSWQDFVQHVRSRSEVVLAAYLRRVAAKVFLLGRLEIEASDFDIASLSAPATLETLKNCLHSYSTHAEWNIRFKPAEGVVPPLQEKEDVKRAGISNRAMPSSVAVQEEKARKGFVEQVTQEAKEQASVKAALEAFGGSAIEKVSVLKSADK